MKIEKGVPIPERKCGGQRLRSGWWKELINKMEDGDSVLLQGTNNMIRSFNSSARQEGFQLCQRKIGEDTYRVWRLGKIADIEAERTKAKQVEEEDKLVYCYCRDDIFRT